MQLIQLSHLIHTIDPIQPIDTVEAYILYQIYHGFSTSAALTLQLCLSLIRMVLKANVTFQEWTCSIGSRSLDNSPSSLHCAGTARPPPETISTFHELVKEVTGRLGCF